MKQTIEEFVNSHYYTWQNSLISQEKNRQKMIEDLTTYMVDTFAAGTESLKYQKPEVLKEGTKVEILESLRDLKWYNDTFKSCIIGKTFTITSSRDSREGVHYGIYIYPDRLNMYTFPHYCVRPISEVKPADVQTELGKGVKALEGLIKLYGARIDALEYLSKAIDRVLENFKG